MITLDESDATILRRMVRWWKSQSGGGGPRPRRGQVLGGGGRVEAFRITTPMEIGNVEDEPETYLIPRASGSGYLRDTGTETLYWVNIPENGVNLYTIEDIKHLWWPNLDIVLCSKWNDDYAILSEPRHTLYSGTYSADDKTVTISKYFDAYTPVVTTQNYTFPFNTETNMESCDVWVRWDWSSMKWFVAAAPWNAVALPESV